LYLCHEEYYYLVDIGYLMNSYTKIFDVFRFILYSHIRRAGKIVACGVHIEKSFKDFYMIYENFEKFKAKEILYIVKLIREKVLTTDQKLENLELAKKLNPEADLVLAIVSSSHAITFIKVKNVS
jgi:hypothetical protein